jgi:hypothetical protein
MSKKCMLDIWDDVQKKLRQGWCIKEGSLKELQRIKNKENFTEQEHDIAIRIENKMTPPKNSHRIVEGEELDIPKFIKEHNEDRSKSVEFRKVEKVEEEKAMSEDKVKPIMPLLVKENIQNPIKALFTVDGPIVKKNDKFYILCQPTDDMLEYFEGKRAAITIYEEN